MGRIGASNRTQGPPFAGSHNQMRGN